MKQEEKKSCSTESERKSRVCQFRVADEHCKKSPTLSCRDRRTTCPAMRQYNNPTHDSSFSRAKTREDTIPLPVNINEKRNKKHSKPASNVSTDNRRMTGNVNIYICSEANDNSAVSSLNNYCYKIKCADALKFVKLSGNLSFVILQISTV